MTDMKAIEGMQLVLRISGAVEESNLVKFEADALEALASIKRDLVTDDDFLDAEQNIKTCKLIADRIATARNTALSQTEAISEVIRITSRVEAKFNEVRLSLEKLVKSEKEKRKDEVVTAARKRLADRLFSSPVKHGFSIDQTAIANAAKNKRSLKNLEDAVNEVIDLELMRLAGMEVAYHNNMIKIEKSEAEWPGLFPDRQNVALSATETVDAMIVGRVADHRLKVAEKARKEQEEADRKRKEEEARAEAARLAESEAERIVLEKLSNPIPQPVATAEISPPEPPPEPFTDFPIPPPIGGRDYTLTVTVFTDDIDRVVFEMGFLRDVGSIHVEE